MSALEVSTITEKEVSVVSASGYVADQENVEESQLELTEKDGPIQNGPESEVFGIWKLIPGREPLKSIVDQILRVTSNALDVFPAINTGKNFFQGLVIEVTTNFGCAVRNGVDYYKGTILERLYEDKRVLVDSKVIERKELRYVVIKKPLVMLHAVLKRYENATCKHLKYVRRFRRYLMDIQGYSVKKSDKEVDQETEANFEPNPKHPRCDSTGSASSTADQSVSTRVLKWFVGPVTPDRYRFSEQEHVSDLMALVETESYHSSEDPDYEPSSPETLYDSSTTISTSTVEDDMLDELNDLTKDIGVEKEGMAD